MDPPRRRLHRSDEAAHRRSLRNLHHAPAGRRRHPQHGSPRSARHRRRRRHGHRSRREKFQSRKRRRSQKRFRPDLRNHPPDAPHRRESVLGDPPHDGEIRAHPRSPHPANQAGSHRRIPAHARRRHRRQPGHGTPRRNPDAVERRRADPLQCRSAGHRRLRHRARRNPRGRRSRQEDSRLRRRDASLSARLAPHRLGADERRHPHHRHLRQHGRSHDEAGQNRSHRRRRRPHRRQRRRGQQNRHLHGSGPGERARHPVLRGRADFDRRPGHAPTAARFPSSSATQKKLRTSPASKWCPTESRSRTPPST